MQSINNKHTRFAFVFSLCALLAVGVLFSGCKDDDDDDGTQIWTVGPGNLERGENLKVNGQKLGSVASVILPSLDGSGIEISRSDFKEVSDSHFEVTLPQDRNLVSGPVKIKLSDGSIIETKVSIKVGSLVIDKFAPLSAKAGQEVTITGEYLSLVQSVVFTSNQIVEQADFVSQSNTEIVVKVPEAAQSGTVGVSDGDVTVYASEKISLALPSVTEVEAKDYKPGVDKIIINGKDLDLVKTVSFQGSEVVDFDSQSETAITFTVPATTKAGDFYIIPASEINIKAGSIALVNPVVEDVVYPDGLDYYLLGQSVTFKGTDLDLITSVSLGSLSVSEEDITVADDHNSLTVKLAAEAQNGATFVTDNGTTISKDLNIVPFLIYGTENPEPGQQVNVNCGLTSTISGVNLQYLSAIAVNGFNATDIKVNDDGTSADYFVVSQAAGASGTWTADGFVTAATNGATVKQSVWAGAPSRPFFLNLPKNAEGGTSIFVNGANFDKINKIEIGGVNAAFSVQDNNNVFINVPAALEEGAYDIALTYDGDQVDKSFSIKVASSVMVLWSGESTLGWDAGKAGFFLDADLSDLEVGGLVKIYMKQLSNDPAWSYLGFRVDQWNEDANWPQYNFSQVAPGEEVVWAFKLTAEQLATLKNLYIYGEGNTAITKITYGEKE